MSSCDNGKGTIDWDGFRKDLASIAANDYPKMSLVKLPFNWAAPAVGGIIQTVVAGSAGVVAHVPQSFNINGVKTGNAILMFFQTNDTFPVSQAKVVTDSQNNTYTKLGSSIFIGSQNPVFCFIALNCVGGNLTVTINDTGFANTSIFAVHALEIGGVTGVRSSSFGQANPVAALSYAAGDLVIGNASTTYATTTLGAWSNNFGSFAQLASGPIANGAGLNTIMNTWSFISGLTQSPTFLMQNTQALNANFTTNCGVSLIGNFTRNIAPGVPPITSISMPGPCNFLALVSEAIDEQGTYQKAGIVNGLASGGYIQFNGSGAWVPFSFSDPLMPGYATATNNYGQTPIAGSGFSAIEAPFHSIKWQPNTPTYYAGAAPPNAFPNLLAIAGMNVGLGSRIGAGNGSTYAIPSAAGPIERMKKAGLL